MSAQRTTYRTGHQVPCSGEPHFPESSAGHRSIHRTPPGTLPSVGMSRWQTLRHFIPISRESWRQLVNSGKAPRPVKLSERCTMYSNTEVHRWLADPVSYRQEQGGA